MNCEVWIVNSEFQFTIHTSQFTIKKSIRLSATKNDPEYVFELVGSRDADAWKLFGQTLGLT